MVSVKSTIYSYLSKTQKSDICRYLTLFVKKYFKKSNDEIFELYIEEEQYYIDLKYPKHPWIEEFLSDETFIKETKLYISELIKIQEIKEKQKPYIEKQKQLAKDQRQKAQEYKMSKEEPTKKQISYFKSLCKKYSIDKDNFDIEGASKLDMKNIITLLLDENFQSEKEIMLNKIQNILFLKNSTQGD